MMSPTIVRTPKTRPRPNMLLPRLTSNPLRIFLIPPPKDRAVSVFYVFPQGSGRLEPAPQTCAGWPVVSLGRACVPWGGLGAVLTQWELL